MAYNLTLCDGGNGEVRAAVYAPQVGHIDGHTGTVCQESVEWVILKLRLSQPRGLHVSCKGPSRIESSWALSRTVSRLGQELDMKHL